MRILITVFIAILLGGGGTFVWLYYGGFQGEEGVAVTFIDQYVSYEEVAGQVEQLVHLPGTEGNVNRSELLTLLESILTKKMEPMQRENLARLALTNLIALKQEIDDAQMAQAKLYEVLQDLDNATGLFISIELRNRAQEIVTLARKRAELSAHATSLLSKNNEDIHVIITRVLTEKGELSEAHITELNSVTGEAEKRFATLESVYRELISKKTEVEATFKSFVEVAL